MSELPIPNSTPPLGSGTSVESALQIQVTLNQTQSPRRPSTDLLSTNYTENNGVVNLKFLKQISRSLKRSSEPKDCSTAKWIDTKYLYQPIEPGEEARWVQSPNDFSRLFNAYEQSMKLTNGVKPRRWPFYPRGGKSVIPAVNSNAGAVAEPGPQSKLVTETMTVPDQENMNKSIEPAEEAVASPDVNSEVGREIPKENTQIVRAVSELAANHTPVNEAASEAAPVIALDSGTSKDPSLSSSPEVPLKSLPHFAGGDVASINRPLVHYSTADEMPVRLTAAHSDPIITNLDSRPPYTSRKKRGSDPPMTTPNKKTKRNSTGSTRGRGKRPRGWNLQRNRKPENGEDNQGEVSTDEQSPEAVTNTPAADGPKEGGIKGRNVTTRAASRLSSAMDRGMTRKSSTLILQYKKKDKINEEDRADKGGVAERDGSPSDEEVVVVHRLDRPQPAPKVNQTQAPASTTKISSETRGLVANGSNPPLKGSESMSTQEPSVPRAGVVGPFTQRPMAEPENNTHPSAGNLSSNAKPAGFGSGRSMYYPSPLNAWTVPAQGPATVKQSAPPPSGTANGIGANWNKTIDLSSRAGNGITMNDNSSRISIGAASKMSNTVPSDAADGISNGASTIKFFARVYSPSGTTEVLLPTEQFTGDPDAIKQYAEWKQQEEGMSLTFDQFVKIFGFARKELMAGPKKGV